MLCTVHNTVTFGGTSANKYMLCAWRFEPPTLEVYGPAVGDQHSWRNM